MEFVLNDKLAQHPVRSSYQTAADLAPGVQQVVYPEERKPHPSGKPYQYLFPPKRAVRMPRVPEGSVVTGSLLRTLSEAYSFHQPVSLAPHDLWYLVLTEVARRVNKTPEHYRRMFTRSQEKIEITVFSADPTYLPLGSIIKELRELVPVNLDLFLPEFSTLTDASRVACMAAFADAVKSFYSYCVMMCGIPKIEIRGTVQDWEMFVSRAHEVSRALGEDDRDWLTKVADRGAKIVDSLRGGPSDFYKDIFTQKNYGSGGQQAVNGWLAQEFFPQVKPGALIEGFPNAWSLVPFKSIDTKRSFVDVFGAFTAAPNAGGFFEADYSNFTFETTAGLPYEEPPPATRERFAP